MRRCLASWRSLRKSELGYIVATAISQRGKMIEWQVNALQGETRTMKILLSKRPMWATVIAASLAAATGASAADKAAGPIRSTDEECSDFLERVRSAWLRHLR